MDFPSRDEMNAFLNALQLCIASPISGFAYAAPTPLIIKFATVLNGDTGLAKFIKLAPGRWKQEMYYMDDTPKIDVSLLTSFLMLTRLQDTQIRSLVEQDGRYRKYAEALALTPHGGKVVIATIADAKDVFLKSSIGKKYRSKKYLNSPAYLRSVSATSRPAGIFACQTS